MAWGNIASIGRSLYDPNAFNFQRNGFSSITNNPMFSNIQFGIDPNTSEGMSKIQEYNDLASSKGWAPVLFNSNGSIDWGDFGKYQDSLGSSNGGFLNDVLGWGKAGFDTIGKIGGLIGGFQQLQLARDALNMQKDAFEFNKRATTTDFNNNVAAQRDAYRRAGEARYSQEGLSGQALNNAVEQRQQNLRDIRNI